MRVFCLFLILLTVSASGLWATDWYVDKSASGANNGSSWANAWQSFADIVWASIGAGDTLYISGGVSSKTYNTRLRIDASGASGNPVTVRPGQTSGHSGKVIIDLNGASAQGSAILVSGQSHVSISGRVGDECHIVSRDSYYNGLEIIAVSKKSD